MKITRLQVFRLLSVLLCLGAVTYLGVHLSWLWLGLTVILFGPFYCGWTCPFGTVSRLSQVVGQKFLPKFQLELPESLRRVLPVCKYILFAGFLFTVVLPEMGITYGADYVQYYKLHRYIKYVFGLPVALVLANYYCRYFCWHKAQYNIFGLASPCSITVDKQKCIGCQSCVRSCPMQLEVTNTQKLRNNDCVMCMQCIEACPLPDKAIGLKVFGQRIPPLAAGIAYFAFYIFLVVVLKYVF